ncbi:MAG TPA: hypothetical protein VFJ09_01125 [Nocardioidaceae bacterium]|nr:hypothetical protein [Nocardioidaceae bacterium]
MALKSPTRITGPSANRSSSSSRWASRVASSYASRCVVTNQKVQSRDRPCTAPQPRSIGNSTPGTAVGTHSLRAKTPVSAASTATGPSRRTSTALTPSTDSTPSSGTGIPPPKLGATACTS